MSGKAAIYPVLCSGHTGSRLLVRLMMANGVFMGAQRSPVGEDEEVFGQMLWQPSLQRTYTMHWKYPDDPRNREALHIILLQAHNKFLAGARALPAPPAAFGFKDATLFPYVAAEYRELMEQDGVRTRFIHLVRHPLHWMLSGRDPKSRGIQRPSRHPNFSRLSDPFIRLVWFDSLAGQAQWKNRSVNLSDCETYSEEEQVMIEAMMWRTTNQFSAALADKPEDYLLVTYEDLILDTLNSLARIGQFIGIPLSPSESVRVNQDRLAQDPRDKLSAESVETTMGICGDLMRQLGIPEEPPLAISKTVEVG